jgi:SET domain-containing protein
VIHIKYKLRESKLHGIGLFTDEDLEKGQVVYTASPILDTNITKEQFDLLDEKEKREIRWWGFWDAPNNVWHSDFDVTRFVNHSFEPTITQDPKYKDAYLVTTRDIKKGEELTQNYREFETKEDLRRRGIKVD